MGGADQTDLAEDNTNVAFYSKRRAALFFLAFVLGSMAALAGPAQKTLAQLAREEGWDPDVGDPYPALAKEIPRDFPVPASSHHLHASNVAPFASVTGTPAETEEFYRAVFASQGWHIKKELKFRGYITFIACKNGQCVKLSCESEEVGQSNANVIDMQFFKDKP